MRENNNLTGNIRQLTIFGQLSFVLGRTYKISKTGDKKTVTVSGDFDVVGTNDVVGATIEIEKHELKKHSR